MAHYCSETRVLFLVLSTALPACRRSASSEDCRRLTEHYLDLAVAEAAPKGASSAEAAAVREIERGLKRADPSFRRVQDRCAAVPRSAVSCAMGAATAAAWESCLRPTDGG